MEEDEEEEEEEEEEDEEEEEEEEVEEEEEEEKEAGGYLGRGYRSLEEMEKILQRRIDVEEFSPFPPKTCSLFLSSLLLPPSRKRESSSR